MDNNIIDVLLDPENEDNITLRNEDGEACEYEQFATINLEVDGEERLYAVLVPVEQGATEDPDDLEVVIYCVEETDEGVMITLETDDDLCRAVMDEVERLLSEYDEE